MLYIRLSVLTVFLSAFIVSIAYGGPAGVASLAQELTAELAGQTSLSNRHIQLVPANFTEKKSGMEFPFSAILSDALGVELRDHSALVSVHEHGDEPLRLVGGYKKNGQYLDVTIRLRQMGLEASNDLGIVSGRVKLDKIDQELLSRSLDTLAAAFIRELELSYRSDPDVQVLVEQPVPGLAGQPSVRLGTALKKALAAALLDSEMFGPVAVGSPKRRIRLVSSYTVADTVDFSVRLFSEDEKLLGRSGGTLNRGELPSYLFELVQDNNKTVCVTYEPSDRRAVPSSSPMAADIVDNMISTLADAGVQPVLCGVSSNGIRVVATLLLKKKKLRDGYGFLSGDLRISVLDGGKAAGIISSKAMQPAAGHINEARTALAEKLVSPVLQQELTTLVLGYRPAN